MNREEAFAALSELDDKYISEAIRYAPEEASGSPERITNMKKRIITLALAAVLLLALSVTAYAAFSAMSARIPDPEETFRISWTDGGHIDWTDAKLVITFPETAESKEIEFRPGWLPYELPSELGGSSPWRDLSSDTWFQRLSSERLAIAGSPNAVAAYENMDQPLLIETYAMSQFNDGGAMLLLYYTPEEIIEEHWDELNVDVMRFHCTQHLDAVPHFNVPERTLEEDVIILASNEEGWVVRLCGEIGMEELLKVAQNLEIRETGKLLTYEDFENHYLFIDGGIG